jgi:MSHA biogenesis protein MshK
MKTLSLMKNWHASWNAWYMRSLFFLLMMALGLASAFPVRAADVFDSLPDPMRPASAPSDGVTSAVQGLVLQSVLIAPQRRLAVINGRTLAIGERIDGATVVDIQAHEVVLKRASGDLTLRLVPRYVSRRADATSTPGN